MSASDSSNDSPSPRRTRGGHSPHTPPESSKRSSKPRKTKSRKINKQHPEFELTYDMMLGIRTVVGKTEARASHQLKPSDFDETIKLRFPGQGSPTTPAHQMRDFKFKDYSPEVFRMIREKFRINPADYLMCVCGNFQYLEFISNSKSGQFFFYTHDRKFMIKTVSQGECKFLRKILPAYYNHIASNPQTLLTRFYGMHRVKPHKKKERHFLIMGSVFYTNKYIHTVFDLKGSTQGRSATEEEKKNTACVYKDLDFLDQKIQLQIGDLRAKILNQQIAKDVEFLRTLDIMDYSLLLGIHYRNRGGKYDEGKAAKSDESHSHHDNKKAQLAVKEKEKANHKDGSPRKVDFVNGGKTSKEDDRDEKDQQIEMEKRKPFDANGNDDTDDGRDERESDADGTDGDTDVDGASSSPAKENLLKNGDPQSRDQVAWGRSQTWQQGAVAMQLKRGESAMSPTHINFHQDDIVPHEHKFALDDSAASAASSSSSSSSSSTSSSSSSSTSSVPPSHISFPPSSATSPPQDSALPSGDYSRYSRKGRGSVIEGSVVGNGRMESYRKQRAQTMMNVNEFEKTQISPPTSRPKRQSQYGLPKRWNITSKPSDISFNAPEFEPIPNNLLGAVGTDEKTRDTAMELAPLVADDEKGKPVPPEKLVVDRQLVYDHGGIPGITKGGQLSNEIYFMGIIDILTIYNMKKRIETMAKSIKYDKKDISSVSPRLYAERFKKFMALAIS